MNEALTHPETVQAHCAHHEPSLSQLFSAFLRMGITAFGGGFASVPLMFHEIVELRSWMDGPTFLNGIVLGQFTPGPIVITATFVGYLVHGFLGALIATIAIFLPSFLILIGIAPWFDRVRSSPRFTRALLFINCKRSLSRANSKHLPAL